MNKSNIKKAAVVIGAAYLGSKLLEKTDSRSANVTGLIGTGSAGVSPESVAAALKADPDFLNKIRGSRGSDGSGLSQLLASSIAVPVDLTTLMEGQTVRSEDNLTTYLVIKKPTELTENLDDEEFFKIIHGPDYAGPVGPVGPIGPVGPRGNDGINSPLFSRSLIENGLLERGNNSIWTGVTIDGYSDGFPVGKVVNFNAYPSTRFYIRRNRLFRISVKVRGTGTVRFGLYARDINNLTAAKSNGQTVSYLTNTTLTENFANLVIYLGGVGTANYNFAENAISASLSITKVSPGDSPVLYFSQLLLEEVALTEPVPSNLPWLPTGQMVLDSVTGDLGRYNGSAVDWLAMA